MLISRLTSTRRGFLSATSALAGASVIDWATHSGPLAADAPFDLLTQLRTDTSAGRFTGPLRLARGTLPVATPGERGGAPAFALQPTGTTGFFAAGAPRGVRAPRGAAVISLFPDAPAEVAFTAQASGTHRVTIDARLLTPAVDGGFRPSLTRRDRHGRTGTMHLAGLVEDRWQYQHQVTLDQGETIAVLVGRARALTSAVLVGLRLRITPPHTN